MKARFLAFTLVLAGLAGCASERTAGELEPSWVDREVREGRPGLFGDLRWTVDVSGKYTPVRATEEEAFKQWREQANSQERREFEEWRAWQEWKRKNPK